MYRSNPNYIIHFHQVKKVVTKFIYLFREKIDLGNWAGEEWWCDGEFTVMNPAGRQSGDVVEVGENWWVI